MRSRTTREGVGVGRVRGSSHQTEDLLLDWKGLKREALIADVCKPFLSRFTKTHGGQDGAQIRLEVKGGVVVGIIMYIESVQGQMVVFWRKHTNKLITAKQVKRPCIHYIRKDIV